VDEGPQQARRRSGNAPGGSLSDKGLSIEFLAAAALVGITPDRFLKTEDPIELECLILVAESAVEQYALNQKNQAALIINYLGKALGSDKKT
jgi:hypothetical protein